VARSVPHSDWIRKNRSTAAPIVNSPIPRPKLPKTLCSGAIEVTVVIDHHAKQAKAILRTARERASVGESARPDHSPA
jgi:hypothetical protein